MALIEWGEGERRLTDRVSVLVGSDNGKYPSGNTLVVRGESEGCVIDPSIDVVARGGAPVKVDAVLNSHAHEDHIPGQQAVRRARDVCTYTKTTYRALRVARRLDEHLRPGGGRARRLQARVVVDEFNFAPRPDAEGFHDGVVFDLGGIAIEAVHLPGHTRGHSGFRVAGDVFFLSDIDLTGFGPYYGDTPGAISRISRTSLRRVRDEDARYYVTYHHKGVIEGRETFLEMLDAFHAVIGRRHDAMLAYLAEPRTLAEMAQHRFIYRPHVETLFADAVERRSAELHVQRMLGRGEAREVEPGRYQRA